MVSIQGRFLIKCGYSGACMVYFRYSFQLIKFTFILIIFSESTVCQSELRKLMQCWLESKRAAIIAIASHYFFPSLFTKDLHLSLFFETKSDFLTFYTGSLACSFFWVWQESTWTKSPAPKSLVTENAWMKEFLHLCSENRIGWIFGPFFEQKWKLHHWNPQ